MNALLATTRSSSVRLSCALSSLLLFATSSLTAQTTAAPAQPQQTGVTVPFVGCKSDGQVGPMKVPQAESKAVDIPAEAAQRLAYYKSAYGFGVLAPRGWNCLGTYGSNGVTLYVSPEPISTDILFSPDWKGFTGPAIQISEETGATSGRFSVARTIARLFPAHMDFVKRVISEGFEPADAFPTGPYPKDKLTYRSKDIVEFETPANTEGLGTASRLLKNGSPVSGLVILFEGEEPNVLHLSIRLPEADPGLSDAIIQHAQRDAAQVRQTEGQ